MVCSHFGLIKTNSAFGHLNKSECCHSNLGANRTSRLRPLKRWVLNWSTSKLTLTKHTSTEIWTQQGPKTSKLSKTGCNVTTCDPKKERMLKHTSFFLIIGATLPITVQYRCWKCLGILGITGAVLTQVLQELLAGRNATICTHIEPAHLGYQTAVLWMFCKFYRKIYIIKATFSVSLGTV